MCFTEAVARDVRWSTDEVEQETFTLLTKRIFANYF